MLGIVKSAAFQMKKAQPDANITLGVALEVLPPEGGSHGYVLPSASPCVLWLPPLGGRKTNGHLQKAHPPSNVHPWDGCDPRPAAAGVDDSRARLFAQTAARERPGSASSTSARRHHDKWSTDNRGCGFEFKPILSRWSRFANRLNVVTGLGHKAAGHPRRSTHSPDDLAERACGRRRRRAWNHMPASTADQVAAQAIGQDTVLPAMELATEDHSGLIGSCDRDYGAST